MNKNWYKILKLLHIIFASICLGGNIVVLILGQIKNALGPATRFFTFDLIVYYIQNSIINYAYYGLLVTIIIIAFFTKWGFFRYYWIIIKWGLLAATFMLYWFWQGSATNGLVALSDAGTHIDSHYYQYMELGRQLFRVTLFQLLVLLAINHISIHKPFGSRTNIEKRKRWMTITASLVIIFISTSVVIQHLNLQKTRNITIQDIGPTGFEDAILTGKAKFDNFIYKVSVTIQNQEITDIIILQNRKNSYAEYAQGITEKILRHQNINVDAITGATTTSKCLLKAIENAFISD